MTTREIVMIVLAFGCGFYGGLAVAYRTFRTTAEVHQ